LSQAAPGANGGGGGYSYSTDDTLSSMDYNVVTAGAEIGTSFAAWQSWGDDAHGLSATLANLGGYFVHPAHNDWALQGTAPAWDRGAGSFAGQSAPAADRLGTARPQGAGWDIGQFAAHTGS